MARLTGLAGGGGEGRRREGDEERRRRCFAWTVPARKDGYVQSNPRTPRLQEPGGNFYRSRDSPRDRSSLLLFSPGRRRLSSQRVIFSHPRPYTAEFSSSRGERTGLSFPFLSPLRAGRAAPRFQIRPEEKCHRVSLLGSRRSPRRERFRGLKTTRPPLVV